MTDNAFSNPLEALFSERSAHIKQSAVRDVFDISVQPGLVSFASGSPNLKALPVEELGEAARRVVVDHSAEALNYGVGTGMDQLRKQITEVMALEGAENVDWETVLVTTGSQFAQDIAAKVFCDEGDVILCEDPTYVGALNAFEVYRVEVVPVATDEHGIIPEALTETIRSLKAAGKRVKMLYTIPSFNNPSGISLAEERRQPVVDACRAENILVLEDNPYGLLKFDGKPFRPLVADNPDDVIYLGSFSKILAPGVRVGWAVIPKALFRRFYLAAEAVVLTPSTVTQLLVSEYLTSIDWRGAISESRALYKERCEAMLAALEREFGDVEGVSWTVPEGGFFVWVTLPEGIDTYPLMREGIDAGVVFIPGVAFSPNDEPNHHLRLAFSNVTPEQIDEGFRRLKPVLMRAIEGARG
ncbi:PLP-dependent aminotransferase family protein [Falsarthrobacter nasiphocae]|uniref:DNA-binding transcriptional MocR family regulator n=1 Tax=Falsarthrobacter nasiphocae TaxID=189863 RepID=A0AAE4C746_9MICC|nr:PLP-dependent aminotransferase family protein [Falsarthrobacter nasiphocae]MDR6892164.1 DNA-binding transcriptional MocR family regulator [Falsarthrobacter nasiphocae]